MDASLRQQHAANPHTSVWVGASAGTGKTKILVDRMLRLYLERARIDKILCLTFTKAAAAEMQNRLLNVLQQWTIIPDDELSKRLHQLIGTPPDTKTMNQARRLFFDILDTEDGLKIQTIHGFCQSLLERFPLEAGIQPGFTLIDEEKQNTLIQNIILQFLSQFPERGDDIDIILKNIAESTFSDLLEGIFHNRLKLQKILNQFPDEIAYTTHLKTFFPNTHIYLDDVIASVKNLLHYVTANCDDPKIEQLRQVILSGEFSHAKSIALTNDGNLRKNIFAKAFLKLYPIPLNVITAFADRVFNYDQQMRLEKVITLTSAFMRIAQSVLQQYTAQKQFQGTLDFDDLIEKTTTLLQNEPMSAWVMYKLDGGIEHILLDEAQDTSVHQWQVILALVENLYFLPDHQRTLFVVGDVKQSIYSFQGASPQQFSKFLEHFNSAFQKQNLPFSTLNLEKSFRSTPAVLNLVDNLFNADKTGLEGDLSDAICHIPHRSNHQGHVMTLPLVYETEDTDIQDRPTDGTWHIPTEYTLSKTKRSSLADQIANHIQDLLEKKVLLPSTNKAIEPSDIIILVKSRTEFIDHVNRSLRERSIPTSGADRFILNEELVIQDLLALARFTQLPEDDYTFACLLKSPLINNGHGLNEEQLFQLAHNREGTLWHSFRNRPEWLEDVSWLEQCLKLADYVDLPIFFQDILNTKRPHFMARFGHECDDLFEAFMEHVCNFAHSYPTSLQNFLLHIEQTPLEIKRDTTDRSQNRVRIMTVHASKGLQASVVYLADCNKSVDDRQERFIWTNDVVLLKPSRSDTPECLTPYLNTQKQQAIEEDRRLLYVAMTRAEDHLFITGTSRNGQALENSWYDLVHRHNHNDGPINFNTAEGNTNGNINIVEIPSHFYSCPVLKIKDPERPLKTPEQDRGIRIHQFFEYTVPLLYKTPPHQWEPLFHKVATQCKLTEKDHNQCIGIIKHPDYQFLWNTKGYNEIALQLDGIEMRLDRLIINDKKAYILDYKSGKLSTSVVLNYKNQLDTYKRAISSLFQIEDIDCFLLFVDVPELMKIN